MEITENSKTLKFDANGLIPAIVQDHYTKEVLTLAYMLFFIHISEPTRPY